LKRTVQTRVTLHVFKVVDKLFTAETNGTHPVAGERVKFGTGGISIHTGFVIVLEPHELEAVKETI
jgi:hypothetical protein